MNDDLIKKLKKRRIRTAAILAVAALFIGGAVWGISFRPIGGMTDSSKQEKMKTAAAETDQVKQEDPAAKDAEEAVSDDAAQSEKKAKEKSEEKKEEKTEAKTDAKAKADTDTKESEKRSAEEKKSSEKKKEKKTKKKENKKQNSSKSEKKKSSEPAPAEPSTQKVTISITCKELSDNMDKLTEEGVEDYIPKNGSILGKTSYTFQEGDTVFDCLRDVCSSKGIQLDSKKDSVYGVYVKGINYIYEFYGGKNSGWMYKVNGKTPNYGAGNYKLSDGDNILWFYTVDYKKE